MQVLVISPIPSHPQNQGNSARIFTLCKMFQRLGARVHFIYVPMEGINPDQFRETKADWDTFEVVPVSNPKTYTSPECFLLDDLYQTGLDERLRALFAQYEFDCVLVNYVWFSRALLNVPEGCPKIIDTHDVFGGRHDRLVADGIAPAWFYTTPEEETRGLARADIVLAIQDDEAEVFRARTATEVRVIGHLLPACFLPLRPPAGKRRVGYIASGNPTNLYSLAKLEEAIRRRPSLAASFEFVLAGPICQAVREEASSFRLLGFVRDVASFYEQVDIVLNPNLGGTGLKIKTIEALSYGRPVICTGEAMVGIVSDAPEHQCPTVDQIVDALDGLTALEPLAAASRRAFLGYQERQLRGVEDLLARVDARVGAAAPARTLAGVA